jgi:DEAD/DEAH box helicase domain-containing protein
MKTPPTAPLPMSVAPLHTDVLASLKWDLVHSLEIPARKGEWVSPASLDLSTPALNLASANSKGLYRHQQLALSELRAGNDTAVTTGTGSGKSLIFQLAAIDALARDPRARALVLYPMRALAEEQHERWTKALSVAGIDARVALFIGDGLTPAQRLKEIASARIIVSTPDVVHAWLMQYRTREKAIRSFLSHLDLLIIDEAHAYTAVFGSQSAFLFRRLDHAVRSLGHRFQVLAASATMADPADHLHSLTGRSFTLIGPEHDSSPAHAKSIHFIKPPAAADMIAGLGSWFRRCADAGSDRFLSFVESRVQAEHFARGAGRRFSVDDDAEVDEQTTAASVSGLEQAAGGTVHAYRSGYEVSYRRELVRDLSSGKISGLVSTSALELGMDLPDLGLGFLIGAPRSSTSLMQRLGRFGRHRPATIFIIADETPASAQLFSAPESLLTLPLQSSTLYLDNPRIQYIHVLCHSREEGWADLDNPPHQFASDVAFPQGFVDLCTKELRGESVAELRALRPAGDEPPHLAFPLRDCDLQFTVKSQSRGLSHRIGTLTYAQVLREAYPGAVYWHAGHSFRVRSVQVTRRTVIVEQCRTAFSKPKTLPPALQPDLSPDAVLAWTRYNGLAVIETQLQARECVSGFRERRGSAVREVAYPLDENDPSGATYANPRFCRHIDTTGVLLTHPALAADGVRVTEIADAILEALLLLVPIERQDIASGTGKFRIERQGVTRSDRFVALYDRTYGSLRLSSRLATPDTLRLALSRADGLAHAGMITDPLTLNALQAMEVDAADIGVAVRETEQLDDNSHDTAGSRVAVIRPGSCGVHRGTGAVFQVASVFYAPDGVRYRGRYDHQKPDDNMGHIAAEQIVELPGETDWTTFDTVAGEIVDDAVITAS